MAMERENRPARGAGKRRKKVCQFCVDKCEHIDYKDAAKAIKRARQIALLPFVTE